MRTEDRRPILETERLILRRMDEGDLADLAQMLQNPRVMYAYEHSFTDVDVRAWLLRQRARYARYGFGLWAAVLRRTGEMVGQAGLTMQPYAGGEVLEIGYLLKEAHWRNGYASEAAAACKAYAFGPLDREKVHSIIKVDNERSIRVAERIGMTREATFLARYYAGDRPHYLYSVRRDTAGA